MDGGGGRRQKGCNSNIKAKTGEGVIIISTSSTLTRLEQAAGGRPTLVPLPAACRCQWVVITVYS